MADFTNETINTKYNNSLNTIQSSPTPESSLRICLVVEATTDVRMVEGLAECCILSILGRATKSKYIVTHPPTVPVAIQHGPASRVKFAVYTFMYLCKNSRKFDCVLVQGYGLTALLANLSRLITKLPVFMLACSPIEEYYRCRINTEISSKHFKYHEMWAMKLVARLNGLVGKHYIVLSRHLESVIRHYSKQATIDNVPVYGVDTSVFLPSYKSKAEIKSEIGLPTSGHLIFFSSRIAPEKDVMTLLKAFKLLLEQGHDLWLLNRSGGYAEIIKAAQRLGIEQRLIATNADHPTQKLPLSYQAADICVQASRAEGLGFSPLEALACGTPVIATHVGGLCETILMDETGWTYPVGDVLALAHCIETVLDNPEEAIRRTNNGREMVIKQFEKAFVFGLLTDTVMKRLPEKSGRIYNNYI